MICLQKVIYIILISTLTKAQMPEDDFRIINRQDLLSSDSSAFRDNQTKSFSQLLFDVARDQVIVGARDTLYRLSLRGLRPLEQASWPAPADKVDDCQTKGQTENDCHNYIKVLLSYDHKLFACGTNAYSPVCSWREIESISTIIEKMNGIAYCPYSPHSNVTALLSNTGEYYSGTPSDFASSDTAVYRSRGASLVDRGTLRSPQNDFKWLYEPQFVGSFEDDHFVYLVFREVAVEYMNCGKAIYSRIARVCKNDSGGQLIKKENWGTFLKARLNCSIPGDYPFYYDEVQSIEYLPSEKILFATFTTPENSIAGSVVCAYLMSDISAAFEGPFKVQESPTSTWEQRYPSEHAREHFNCMKNNSRTHDAIEYHTYHLMYDAVQPISGEPFYKRTLQRFTHITVDVTQTKLVGKQYVAFVATLENELLKISVLPRFEGACLVEIWKLADGDDVFDVQALQFVKDTMSVYIGSDTGVTRIGAYHCERYKSRTSCVRATDPYCGWDERQLKCVDSQTHLHSHHFIQETDRCAPMDAPIDGGWSSWSEWAQCVQEKTVPQSPYSDQKPDMCMCRSRQCDNPAPANGGQECEGATISVTNCTVHGHWSPWSDWSACSATCGIAIKTRRRSCSAPAPQHGGRVCVGIDTNQVYCSDLPPCPDPALAPVDGGWSSWGPWSSCASEGGPGCGPGAGWKERRRTCTNPAPMYGGLDCEGSKIERQLCDMRACEVRRATAWTPWVTSGNSSDGSYAEKRFKFSCRAPSPEQIKLTIAKEEERYCNAHGSCSSTPPEEEEGWGPWGPWGACSVSCGGGHQSRARTCHRAPCRGPDDMIRPCNTHACTGEWSCWSDWGECTGACGAGGAVGRRTRSRTCLSPEGCADAGAALEKRLCINNCADKDAGFSEWGDWSSCLDGKRTRTRICLHGACVGPVMQAAYCGQQDIDNSLPAMTVHSEDIEMASFVTSPGESMSVGGIVGLVITAFILGFVFCLTSVAYLNKRHDGSMVPRCWRRAPRVPSSPHYITAKQNSYVTVPLKDVPRKAKRQPSFTGISSAGSTLLSKTNNISNANNHNNTLTTPKLYPKAIANEYESMGTIRRHSNQPNNRNNADYDEEKFY